MLGLDYLSNKNVLVTGATSGIGKALVIKLINAGANVAFCGRSASKLDDLVSLISEKNNQLVYEAFDITEYQKVSDFIARSNTQLGGIDYLVNCAGVNSARAAVNEIELGDLEWMIKVNILAPFACMKEVFNQAMLPQGAGSIINVMSTVCLFSNQGIGAYTASKSGFDALTKVFRKEARQHGVKVCNIYPGGVDTPFREADRPEYLAADDVVSAILTMMLQSPSSCVDEFVIRPMVESNFS
ncbi:SDR family oxidoreductase [Vibrio sp. SCSIO 43135]|uniref:SDR family oxidoreductase n=1 Tax=Vibrio sp. SCSIO 43135 TaxID=2819096 RepID=UPI002074B0C6|nr:SDR family oxidoreductase [Vibrio sp. SCSIO 43135]USD42316.1 SDR family oxidoreductase [Vibrio sp. SCSIO 43135]